MALYKSITGTSICPTYRKYTIDIVPAITRMRFLYDSANLSVKN